MSSDAQGLSLDDLFRSKTKVAFKALGGRAKAVYWHLGVAKALETLGYRFAGGERKAGQARPYGPFVVNPIIGSSAGALFAALIARSGQPVDEVARTSIPEEMIFQRTGIHPEAYVRRVKNHVEFRTGRRFRIADLKLLDFAAITASYTVQGLEKFLREEVLKGANRFEDLLAELYIMGTELDNPRTVVFGERMSEQISDYIYQCGVPVSEAAAASMALPPIYAPYATTVEGRRVFCIDGEMRDPFTTNVAEESGADLVFVSCVYQAYQFSREFGPMFDMGILGVYPQSRDQSMDAKKQIAIYGRRRMQQTIQAVEDFAKRNLPVEKRDELVKLLESQLESRRSNTIVYITPVRDLELYRVDPFDLSERTKRLVMIKGYDRTFQALEEAGLLHRSAVSFFPMSGAT